MGEVLFLDFHQKSAIGTGGLGACSVAMVVSEHGAILAHIPPLPSSISDAEITADPDAGNNNVHTTMRQVREMHECYQAWFPTVTTYVVCAWYQGEVALPDQLDIMQGHFRDMGLEPAMHNYVVPGDRANLGQGTVIIISSAPGTHPFVYVEDTLVNTHSGFADGGMTSPTGQAATTAEAATIGSISVQAD